jgi:hypothetical protein
MPVTAGEIITDARDLHPAFDGTRNPDGVLRRALRRAHADLWGRVMVIEPDVIRDETAIQALPLGNFAAGFIMPDPFVRILGGRVFANLDELPLSLVPQHQRFAPSRFPAAIEQFGTVYLVGSEADWTDYTGFSVEFVPQAPTAFASNAALIQLPDDAQTALVHALGAFMANRTEDAPNAAPIDRRQFRQDADAERDRFLERIGHRKVVVAQIPELW